MTGPTTASLGRRPAALPADVPVIDVDVHTVAPTIETLFPWLDRYGVPSGRGDEHCPGAPSAIGRGGDGPRCS